MQGQAAGKFNLECLSKMMEMEYSWDWRKQFALSPTGTRAENLNLNRVIMKKKQQSKYVIIHSMFFFFFFKSKHLQSQQDYAAVNIVLFKPAFFLASSLREMEGCFRKEVQQTLSPWTLSWLTPRWKTLIWVVSSVRLVHYNHKKPTLGEPWYYDSPWQPATKKLSEYFTPLKLEIVSVVKREKIKFECSLFI